MLENCWLGRFAAVYLTQIGYGTCLYSQRLNEVVLSVDVCGGKDSSCLVHGALGCLGTG